MVSSGDAGDNCLELSTLMKVFQAVHAVNGVPRWEWCLEVVTVETVSRSTIVRYHEQSLQ
jgi:hypothetical protein